MNAIFRGPDFENGPFKHDFSGEACTEETVHYELPCYFDEKTLIKCVDTPGLNEGDSKDSEHMKQMISYLKDKV